MFYLKYLDMSGEVHALAEAAVKNIHEAVIVAEKKIRSSITLAVLNTDIQNNKIKTEALSILRKVLSKRSLGKGCCFPESLVHCNMAIPKTFMQTLTS